MDIQLINFSGKNEKGYSVKEVKTYGTLMSLGIFDLSIVYLMSEYILRNSSGERINRLELDNNFKSVKAKLLRGTDIFQMRAFLV